MNTASIISGRMLDELDDFFPSTCTIKENSGSTADGTGQMSRSSFVALGGHSDIPCCVASAASMKGRTPLPDMVLTATAVVIQLQGSYTSITTKMQAVVGSTTYQITAVLHDSQGSHTQLVAEVVTT